MVCRFLFVLVRGDILEAVVFTVRRCIKNKIVFNYREESGFLTNEVYASELGVEKVSDHTRLHLLILIYNDKGYFMLLLN